MRKLAVFTVMIIFLFLCCSREKLNRDLLYGNWIAESNAGHPGEMIDFKVGGDYCLVGYINVLPGGVTFCRYTITGEYEVDGHYVTLVSAEVQSMDEEPEPGGFPYEGVEIEDGVPFGSFFGSQGSIVFRTGTQGLAGDGTEYAPVTWEVLTLTEDILEVKVELDTIRYLRQ